MALCRSEIKIFLTSFFVGFFTHIFIITNIIHCPDSITYTESMGAGSVIGRFIIEIANIIMYKLGYIEVVPSLYILIFLFIISISSIYIIRILQIRNVFFKYLIAIIMIVSPSLTQITIYAFTTPIYAMAILLTILSVYFVLILDNIFFAVISNLIAIGIYQAYLPIAICLYALYFLKKIIYINKDDIKSELKKMLVLCGKAILTLVWSLILYFPLNSIINRRNGQYVVKAFHGMSNNLMPIITIDKIFESIKNAYIVVLLMVKEHNVLSYNTTIFIRFIYFILFTLTLILFFILIKKLIETKKMIIVILSILIFIMLPLCINFIYIMTMNSINIKTDDRMFFSYIFYIIIPIFIFESLDEINKKDYIIKNNFLKFNFLNKIKNKINIKIDHHLLNYKLMVFIKKALSITTIFIIIHNIWLAHGSYFNFYKKEEASKNYAIELAANIKSSVPYKVGDKIAFIGSVPLTNEEEDYDYYSGMKYNLYINDNADFDNLITDYAWKNFLKTFTAMDFNFVPDDLRLNLTYSKTVKNMPIYPNAGSIIKKNDVIIVKLGGVALW